MATITARMTARKGLSTALPKLLPGELGLATDIQKTFIGQEPVVGSCDITNSTNTTAIVEFMSAAGYPVDLDEITTTDLAYGITVTDSFQDPPVVTEILGANISFDDQKATFTHPLKEQDGVTTRDPVGANDISAGSFVSGLEYTIKTPGTTDFTLIGAADSNIGTVFRATGIGTGDGVATQTADIFSLWYNKEVGYVAEVFTNPARTVTFTAAAASTPQTTGIEFLVENKESVTLSYTLETAGGGSRRGTLSILLDNSSGTPTTHSIKDEYDISTGSVPVKFSLTHNSVDKFILNFETTDTVNAHTFTYIQKSFK